MDKKKLLKFMAKIPSPDEIDKYCIQMNDEDKTYVWNEFLKFYTEMGKACIDIFVKNSNITDNGIEINIAP